MVIEGESGVNIVQQRTAVAPIVEVRDRNDQPVSGALVRFTIRRGRATFNGARALSVTTDAAGRATATGLTPTGTGALQIGAATTVRGESAAVAISQTNVLATAQGVAATGAAVGGAATAGAIGGGAGGGISATTVGILAGAAGGGSLIAAKATGDELGPASGAYSGTLTLTAVSTVQAASSNPASGCTWSLSIPVTLFMDFDEDTKGNVLKGHLDVSWREQETSRSCPFTQPVAGTYGPATIDFDGQRVSDIHITRVDSGSPPGGGTRTITIGFAGALQGDVIVGTLSLTSSTMLPQIGVQEGYPTASGPVTLRRQSP